MQAGSGYFPAVAEAIALQKGIKRVQALHLSRVIFQTDKGLLWILVK